MDHQYLTPPDLLVRGLGLGTLPNPPQAVPPGTCCAVTGKPISRGYPVTDLTTDSTTEFLDFFRGGVNGFVSEETARCMRVNAAPSAGNPTARAAMVFADGTYYNPLISAGRGVTQAAQQYLDDDVVRHLAAATLLQAWNDALGEDEEEALAAQEWLIMHPWAEALCDCCGMDRGRLVGKLEDVLRSGCAGGG